MVKHIVLYTLKEGVDKDCIPNLKAETHCRTMQFIPPIWLRKSISGICWIPVLLRITMYEVMENESDRNGCWQGPGGHHCCCM